MEVPTRPWWWRLAAHRPGTSDLAGLSCLPSGPLSNRACGSPAHGPLTPFTSGHAHSSSAPFLLVVGLPYLDSGVHHLAEARAYRWEFRRAIPLQVVTLARSPS